MAAKFDAVACGSVERLVVDVANGDRPMWKAITDAEQVLGWSREDAMVLMHLLVGRLYSSRQYETALSQLNVLPGMRKSWQFNGNHPLHHPGHASYAAQNLRLRIEQPFVIVDPRTGEIARLLYPRDAAGGEEHSIGCGCMMIVHPPDDPFAESLSK